MSGPNFPSDKDDAPLVARQRRGDNSEPLSITEVSRALKRTVEDQFGHVKLRGELSGVKRAASGHLYCSLKDEGAVIDGVMWRSAVPRLTFKPEDGIEVVATGKLTTYAGRSKYQIVMERMEIAGEGALLAMLEKMRVRLAAEGLFAEERKRALPFAPRVIGVVTSPTGAVIRDILHRLRDRFPSHVLLWPVIVQGQDAAEQIAEAVRGFGAIEEGGPVPKPDVLIVGRGGGAIEDLWAFNEEVVVRAIARSPIPVISAVGHETDTTLADFAADKRAPTPTAAAEMAVPVRRELEGFVSELSLRQRRAGLRPIALGSERLAARAGRLPRADQLLQGQVQQLDDMSERLRRGLLACAALGREKLATLRMPSALLGRHLREARAALVAQARRLPAPEESIDARQHALDHLRALLRRGLSEQASHSRAQLAGLRLSPAAVENILRNRKYKLAGARLEPIMILRRIAEQRRSLAALARLAEQLHPERPLQRGYAIVRDAAGIALTSAADAREHASLAIQFADGTLKTGRTQKENRVGTKARDTGAHTPSRSKRPAPQKLPEKDQPKLL